MKFSVIVFPGANCDDDMMHVLGSVMQADVRKCWHKETSLGQMDLEDCVILPGGFSYGDYLRAGAIARFSPIMKAVVEFADAGGRVFGICNGFQVLCEAGLLPGVLIRNKNQKFISKSIHIQCVTSDSPVTSVIPEGKVLRMPIAHADGQYFIDPDGHRSLVENDQIIFRYCDEDGRITAEANENGSVDSIAGICNVGRNIVGMMPHPERASEEILGNTDGKFLFDSLLTVKKEVYANA